MIAVSRPIFPGRAPLGLFEHKTEVTRILISHFRRNLSAALVALAQELLGPGHALHGQVFHKGLAHALAEDGAEVVGADIDGLCHVVQRDVFIRIMLVNVLDGTADDASALLPGLLVAQADRCVQHIPEVALQALAAQVDLRRGQPAEQRLPVQAELPHGGQGVDARAEDQIMPEHHGIDGGAEIAEELRDKIIDFFQQALLHKAGDDGRIQLPGVDGAVALSRGAVLAEKVHGQDMLPRNQMAEGEGVADRRIALMQTAETGDGGPDRHVPVDREIPAAAVPADGLDALIGQGPDLLRRALDQNRVAQKAAAEQQQVRHADKGLKQGLFGSGEFFGVSGDAARHMNAEQDNVVAFRVQINR